MAVHLTTIHGTLVRLMKRSLRWSFRGMLGIVALVIALAIAGAIYETFAEAQDRRAFPPPGRMVQVGGFRLHLYCSGKGNPAVLIEAGFGSRSLDWLDVQKRVARFTQVCTYDRAGIGWSDPGPHPRDVKEIADELNRLIANGGLSRPLILVGHSFGGFVVRMFAYEHPNEVAGMVLVDAADENVDARLPIFSNSWKTFRGVVIANEVTAPFGVVRLALRLRPEYFASVPPAMRPLYLALWCRPAFWREWLDEADSLPADEAEIRQAELPTRGYLGNIPLIVIRHKIGDPESATTAGLQSDEVEKVWQDAQTRLASLSKDGELIVADQSGHSIMSDQPDLVAQAIENVVTKVRAQSRSGF